MNHQLFEKWLLARETLSPDQEQQLQGHLEQCTKCRSQAAAWDQVAIQLTKVEFVTPRPGFSKRWLASLPERKRSRTKNLVRTWLFGLGGAALLSLIILIAINTASATPSGFVLSLTQNYQRAVGLAQQARNFLFIIVNKAPYVSWLALGVIVLSGLMIGALAWILITTRKHSRGGVENETIL